MLNRVRTALDPGKNVNFTQDVRTNLHTRVFQEKGLRTYGKCFFFSSVSHAVDIVK